MKSKVRIKIIILPALVGLIISIIYSIFLIFLMQYLINSYGSAFRDNFFPLIYIIGIAVSLFIGVVTYFICFKKNGTVIERFVSGIFFPFILGFLSMITLVFPSFFYGIEFAQNHEILLKLIFGTISNWIIKMLEIFFGSALMHFIITRKDN